ncbi:MAG: lytic transglycosylase domain-containing protein [Bacteroidia bacterium]|nr:lytic transglycosylase domain-containing protein [Bacteroidia bacterium]
MSILNKKIILTAIMLVAVTLSLFAVIGGLKGFSSTPSDRLKPDTTYSNKTYKLPDKVTFAGEKMPLDNFDTRESLERELLTSAYRHSSTILIIKRANRYLPVIEKILKQNDIPDDFKYLAAAESEYSNMISPAGATGFWQIMQETGREEGMEINSVVDERYDVERSTQFACDYFRKSYEKFGNWTLAAASYNGGRAAIDEQIQIQKQNNYYDLLLTEETARYIFRAVAYKLVITDPENYGFKINKDELYTPVKYFEVTVDSAISDFSKFADQYRTNYKLLKLLNPWLRKPYLTPKPGKSYIIKIPDEDRRNGGSSDTVN